MKQQGQSRQGGDGATAPGVVSRKEESTAPGRVSRRDGAHLLVEWHSGGMEATASQIACGGGSTTPGRVSRRDGATVP